MSEWPRKQYQVLVVMQEYADLSGIKPGWRATIQATQHSSYCFRGEVREVTVVEESDRRVAERRVLNRRKGGANERRLAAPEPIGEKP